MFYLRPPASARSEATAAVTQPKFSPEVYVELAERGYSNVAIAQELGVGEASVRRGLVKAGYKRHLLPLDKPARYEFDLDEPTVLRDIPVMIAADLHNPLYDPEWVNRMISTARVEEIKTLVMGGDFFNFDALSQYDPKQEDAGLEREWREGLRVMDVLLETFDRIIYVWGNHDARLHRALGFKTRFATAMQMVFGSLGAEALKRIEFSNLDHCWIEYTNEDGSVDDVNRWYICHPANYSRVPLSTPRRLAAIKNANVITAHSHHCAVGYAENGRYVVAEAGGLFDADKTAYLQRSTTFPRWQNGFSYLVDRELRVVSEAWSLAAAA